MMNERKTALVSLLLGSFPTFQSGDAEAALASYELVMRDFGNDDVEAAVTMLLDGKFSGHDGRFVPTAPQLAGALRKVRDDRLESERRARPVLALPEPEIEKSAESRRRVLDATDQIVKALSRDMLTPEATVRKRREFVDRVNGAFAPSMNPGDMKDRLGIRDISVGDPEGNKDAGEAA